MSKVKKISALVVLTMGLVVLSGCSSTTQNTQAAANQSQPKEIKVYQGVGQIPNFRVGPGKDKEGVQVYSINYVTASGTFDKDGKIINLYVDGLEVSTPNYDGESMPHFSGWPGTPGYNVTDHASEKVTGVSTNNNDTIAAEVNGWKSKRERGDNYGMNPKNDWYKQMNNYQKFFTGKTIAEVEQWFAKNVSDVTGRPLTEKATDPKDKEKLAKLTDAEKKALVDVTSGSTMSLKDGHGNFIGAIKKAYENRIEVTIPVK